MCSINTVLPVRCTDRTGLTDCLSVCLLSTFSLFTYTQCRQITSAVSFHWLPLCQCISYKLAVVTYKTRTTSTPTYLSHLIHDCNPGCCLRSADILLHTVSRTSLALSPKAFSVSAPAVWNSLSFNCKSCKLFSTFARVLKTELFDTAYST